MYGPRIMLLQTTRAPPNAPRRALESTALAPFSLPQDPAEAAQRVAWQARTGRVTCALVAARSCLYFFVFVLLFPFFPVFPPIYSISMLSAANIAFGLFTLPQIPARLTAAISLKFASSDDSSTPAQKGKQTSFLVLHCKVRTPRVIRSWRRLHGYNVYHRVYFPWSRNHR